MCSSDLPQFQTFYIDRSQVEELRKLRQQAISRREEYTVYQHGQGEIGHASLDSDDDHLSSPVSSSSESHSSFEEEDDATAQLRSPENAEVVGHLEGERNQGGGDVGGRDESYQNELRTEPTGTGIVSLPPESNSNSTNKPAFSAWDVEFNSDTTATLNLNLVQKLTQKGRSYLTFSMDGKYLATASSLGIVSIFDSKTGKRIS